VSDGATGGTACASSAPHLSDVAMTHPAQQLRGGNSARLEPGLRVAGVRAERLHLGDRRPGRSRRLRAPPRQPRHRDATVELPRANRSSWNGSGAPTRYLPNAAARPISASRVGPSCQDTRHAGRSHSTDTLTCASSDSTLDHTFAPSDRFILARPVRNEILHDCNVTSGNAGARSQWPSISVLPTTPAQRDSTKRARQPGSSASNETKTPATKHAKA